MLLDTDKIRKSTFRNLVLSLFASFVYDIFWLLVSTSAYNKDDTGGDGGVEKGIRSFSLTMTFISVLFRVRIPIIKSPIDNRYYCLLERFNRLPENY